MRTVLLPACLAIACLAWLGSGPRPAAAEQAKAPEAARTRFLSPEGSDADGDGSRDRPWRSLHHAAGAVGDGSTVVLLDGLYEGGQSIEGQFPRGLTIRADHPYHARLRSAPGRNRLLSCYNASGITLEGLEMYGSGGTEGEFLIHISTPSAHRLRFENCIIHDCYNNDLVKINAGAHDVVFRGCVLFNQTDHPGDEHFDINAVTDVTVEDSILFNDYAGSGRREKNQSHAFIVVKDSGTTPDVTARVTLRRNIFLNWEGLPDEAFILLGEDGQPFTEARQVTIENNLFIHNSPVRSWGTLLFKGGLRDITVRSNTVVGTPRVGSSGAEAVVCLQIGRNLPMSGLTFCNNLWCDDSGHMPRISQTDPRHFAPDSPPRVHNNLYWNAGKPIPADAKDALTPAHDAAAILADPRLPFPPDPGPLPRLDASNDRFLSGAPTIRAEFERLVARYATPAPDGAGVGKADATNEPEDDILGRRRPSRGDVGCLQSSSK